MKKLLLTALIAMTTLTTSCSKPDVQEKKEEPQIETSLLVGKWNSTETNQCGPEAKLTFLVNRTGSIYDSYYNSTEGCQNSISSFNYTYQNDILSLDGYECEVITLNYTQLVIREGNNEYTYIRE